MRGRLPSTTHGGIVGPKPCHEPWACAADGGEKEVSIGLHWATVAGSGKRTCRLALGWSHVRKSAGLNTRGGVTATLNPIEGDIRRLRLTILPKEGGRAAGRVAGGSSFVAGCGAGLASSAGVQQEGGKESVAEASAQAMSVEATPEGEISPGVCLLADRHHTERALFAAKRGTGP